MSNSSVELVINELIAVSRSMFNRGYSFGTTGNVSVRVGKSVSATPTGSSLGKLKPDSLARCDLDGNVAGPSCIQIRKISEAMILWTRNRWDELCGALIFSYNENRFCNSYWPRSCRCV